MTECKKRYKIPIFCRIGNNSQRKFLQSNVSSKKIKNMERKKLLTEEKKHQTKMDNLQFDFNSNFEKIKQSYSDSLLFEKLITKIMGKIVATKKNRDKKRDKKLDKILNSGQVNTLEIINLTLHEIPNSLIEI